MEFRILGPLEVLAGGSVVPISGARQRGLLAILVLSANEVVSADRLIEELWGAQPPESGRAALQVRVSQLRKALGEAGAAIRTQASGYVLRVEEGQLDLDRFERLVAEAAGADPSVAADTLREALGLWRGPALADLAYEPFAQTAIRRLEELRLVALERRIEADLALRRHRDLVAELETLVAEHPLREALRGQLMLALYRCGRQADALAIYKSARAALVEELGLEPSQPLRELEQAILRQDASLELAPRPPAGNLPVPATPFLGRVRELAELTALLRRPETRLLTLTGAGGSGKTRLALRLAQAVAPDYPDGAWFIAFADITDPELITPTVCQTLGLAEQSEFTPAERLQKWLRERSLLLLLDNLEQLVHGTTVLSELLAASPSLRLLATSRVPLHLAGEQQYDVPVLEPDDAIGLFTNRARAVAPSLSIDPDLAGRICDRLDHLPLAIELAAARAKTLALAEILDRLQNQLPVLATGPRDAPQRQRTLQAAIDWSYQLLTEREQRSFRRLAVFAGGFTLQAAETVCQADLDTLQALVDHSLIRHGDNRYRMLQTLRQHAIQKLDQAGEADELRRRHVAWVCGLLQAGTRTSLMPEQRGRAALIASERENCRAALDWAAEDGQHETVAQVVLALTEWMWGRHGQLGEADRWLAIAREHLADYPLALRARVLSSSRWVAWMQGDIDQAASLCDRALVIYRELGDADGLCWEMMGSGVFAHWRGDLAGAREEFEAVLRYARERGVALAVPIALMNLGEVAIYDGRLDEAQTLCEQGLALTEELDPTRETDQQLINLAHIANLQNRRSDAEDFGRRALTAAIAHQEWVSAARAVRQIAWSLAGQGHAERACLLLGAAVGFHQASGGALQHIDKQCEDRARELLSHQLDPSKLQALLGEGRNIPIEDASHDALDRQSAP